MSECKVCYAIRTSDASDAQAIVEALDDPIITNVDLAYVLTNNDIPVTEASIRRHINHKENA